MSRWLLLFLALVGVGAPGLARAAVTVRVDIANQTMTVDATSGESYAWKISTGRIGYRTPNGTYRPQRLEKFWRSRTYGMAPMPHSIFFHAGYAIHATDEVRRLGRTASHGCIRLAPGNAAALFAMVQRHSMAATRIIVTGAPRDVERAPATRLHEAPRFAPVRRPSRPLRPRLFDDDDEYAPYPVAPPGPVYYYW